MFQSRFAVQQLGRVPAAGGSAASLLQAARCVLALAQHSWKSMSDLQVVSIGNANVCETTVPTVAAIFRDLWCIV